MAYRHLVKNRGNLIKLIAFVPNKRLHLDMINGFNWEKSPQGYDYWLKRYYWVAQQDVGFTGTVTPMSDEDWGFIKALITPEDPFLLAEENKEYAS